MQLHLFHFAPHGLARAYSHLVAGKKLCRATGLKLRPLIPDSVNSMTAAWNVYQTFEKSGLPRPRTIIDVGANVSQIDARVLSFEPNQKLFPSGEVHRVALSDTDGTTDFFIPQNDSDWGTIESGKVNITSNTARYSVPTRRMESLIENGEIEWKKAGQPVFVKIDTEGSEKKVIDGFGKYLSDVSYLLVEVENQEARGQNYNLISLCTALAEKGFDCAKIVYSCYDGPEAPAYSDILFWRSNKS